MVMLAVFDAMETAATPNNAMRSYVIHPSHLLVMSIA
jgi:hypothetical protein